ncbi:unnamed protein product [Blepharisma stoltei]|uniref:Uncharacterized protein n=1 Tax=Blepharisma stoltei TaxID=1481888 RepID=A0AAU9JA31_9CILI|nr:unnamed protein product [Blepharisma stoltei]
MEENKNALFGALSKALSVNIHKPSMYLEKLPAGSPPTRQRVYELLSKDQRMLAFDFLSSITTSTPRLDYIDAVLFAARFLLGNQLINECYIFLKICQNHLERTWGEPIDYSLVEEIGNMFYLTGQCNEAVKWYEKLMEMNEAPESKMYFNIGMCYQVMGNISQAIEAYLKSTLADSRFTKSWVNLGSCYLQIGKGDKAIAAFQNLPLSAESLTCIGNAYFKMGNFEEAIAHYLRAIEIKEEPGTYNNLGAALKKVGLLQDAIYAFNDSLALQPNADAGANLLILYIETGKFTEAQTLFRSIARILPSNESKMISKILDERKPAERRSTMIGNKAIEGLLGNLIAPALSRRQTAVNPFNVTSSPQSKSPVTQKSPNNTSPSNIFGNALRKIKK